MKLWIVLTKNPMEFGNEYVQTCRHSGRHPASNAHYYSISHSIHCMEFICWSILIYLWKSSLRQVFHCDVFYWKLLKHRSPIVFCSFLRKENPNRNIEKYFRFTKQKNRKCFSLVESSTFMYAKNWERKSVSLSAVSLPPRMYRQIWSTVICLFALIVHVITLAIDRFHQKVSGSSHPP